MPVGLKGIDRHSVNPRYTCDVPYVRFQPSYLQARKHNKARRLIGTPKKLTVASNKVGGHYTQETQWYYGWQKCVGAGRGGGGKERERERDFNRGEKGVNNLLNSILQNIKAKSRNVMRHTFWLATECVVRVRESTLPLSSFKQPVFF